MLTGKRLMFPAFEVRTDFIQGHSQTAFDNCLQMALNYYWDSEFQQGVWTFPESKREDVERQLGIPIVFGGEEPRVVPMLTEKKGQGEFFIELKTPNFYRIVTTIGNGKVRNFDVPSPLITTMWQIINKRLKVGESCTSMYIAEKMMENLEITRFNREDSGSFDWAKFSGTRGTHRDKGYFLYLYYPLKVLHAEEVINYKGSDIVTKLKDHYEIQTEFGVIRSE